MKSGTVALIGRPNVGKSTLVNTIVGQKVSITSPKPQTTRFPIEALYEDERGQILFIDTPGIFQKTTDKLSQTINKKSLNVFERDVDIFVYIVDPTRERLYEEGRVLGLVRGIKKTKLLVFNKCEIKDPKFMPHYEFLKDEFPPEHIFYLSALSKKHIKPFVDALFTYLPEGEKIIDSKEYVFPGINIDSHTFIAEIIREKVYLTTRQKLPYTINVVTDEIVERSDTTIYIKARIITTELVYKKMLIGHRGEKIKTIGSMARREFETATGKKIYLELTVEEDKNWINCIS